jgi:hypothetical protein
LAGLGCGGIAGRRPLIQSIVAHPSRDGFHSLATGLDLHLGLAF